MLAWQKFQKVMRQKKCWIISWRFCKKELWVASLTFLDFCIAKLSIQNISDFPNYATEGKRDVFPHSNKFSGLIFSHAIAWHSSGICFCLLDFVFSVKGLCGNESQLISLYGKNIFPNVITAMLYLCSSFHKTFFIKITRDSSFYNC